MFKKTVFGEKSVVLNVNNRKEVRSKINKLPLYYNAINGGAD